MTLTPSPKRTRIRTLIPTSAYHHHRCIEASMSTYPHPRISLCVRFLSCFGTASDPFYGFYQDQTKRPMTAAHTKVFHNLQTHKKAQIHNLFILLASRFFLMIFPNIVYSWILNLEYWITLIVHSTLQPFRRVWRPISGKRFVYYRNCWFFSPTKLNVKVFRQFTQSKEQILSANCFSSIVIERSNDLFVTTC